MKRIETRRESTPKSSSKRKGEFDADSPQALPKKTASTEIRRPVVVKAASENSSEGTFEDSVDAADMQTSPGNRRLLLDNATKQQKIAEAMKTIIECLGEDPSREGLLSTPNRAAKALMYFTSGYCQRVSDVVGEGVFSRTEEDALEDDSDELVAAVERDQVCVSDIVMVHNIDVHSLCEHHLVPFFGKVHVAYIPSKKIIGLSKLARISDLFSRRLQVQERLTEQIASAVMNTVEALGVAVLVEAEHMCMRMRGVQKAGCATTTTSFKGVFMENAELRREFLSLIPSGRHK